jgi:hypothetical protein
MESPKAFNDDHPGTCGGAPFSHACAETTTPRRKNVRKYDRENPRESELPPEIADLLMKLNQQDTLVDMWR